MDGKRFGMRPNYLPQSGSYGEGSNFFDSSATVAPHTKGSMGSGLVESAQIGQSLLVGRILCFMYHIQQLPRNKLVH